MLRASTTSFYDADGLGSITSLSNAAGALVQTYTFDSFGKQTASTGSLTNSFRYTAREFDAETSLYYYRARYYDPQFGKFTTEDPITFRAGTNFYTYTGNRAVNFVDASGFDVTVTIYQGAGGFGHIGIGVNSTQTVGFYPLSVPIIFILPTGGTILINSYNLSPLANFGGILPDDPSHKIDSITIKTTAEQDRKIQAYIDARKKNPGIYNLFARNCTSFVRAALQAGGVDVPPCILPAGAFCPLKFPGHDPFPRH